MAIHTAEAVLDALGIERSACRGSLRLQGSAGCLSTKAGRNSLAQPHRIQIDSLEKLRSLVGGAARAGFPEDLDAENQLRQALFAHIVGAQHDVSTYGSQLAERYLPLSVIVYTGDDIEIKKGEVLDIEPDGHDPVVVNYRIVKLEEGGQIRCHAPVLMTVEKFIKKKSFGSE